MPRDVLKRPWQPIQQAHKLFVSRREAILDGVAILTELVEHELRNLEVHIPTVGGVKILAAEPETQL